MGGERKRKRKRKFYPFHGGAHVWKMMNACWGSKHCPFHLDDIVIITQTRICYFFYLILLQQWFCLPINDFFFLLLLNNKKKKKKWKDQEIGEHHTQITRLCLDESTARRPVISSSRRTPNAKTSVFSFMIPCMKYSGAIYLK